MPTPTEITALLRQVPEARLQLFDLLRSHVMEDGRVDMEQLLLNHMEVQEAIQQAQSYHEGHKRMLNSLRQWCRALR